MAKDGQRTVDKQGGQELLIARALDQATEATQQSTKWQSSAGRALTDCMYQSAITDLNTALHELTVAVVAMTRALIILGYPEKMGGEPNAVSGDKG